MTDERDIKRSMIPKGTGSSIHGTVLQEGDDVPKTDAEAPTVGQSSPKPITLQSMAKYLRSVVSDSQSGNVYAPDEQSEISTLRSSDGSPAAISTPSEGVFAPAELLASLGAISETFDDETLRALKDPATGLHEVLRTIIGNPQDKLLKSGHVAPVNVSTGKSTSTVPENAPKIQKKISEVLQRNRFNPQPGKTPFAAGLTASEIDKRPMGKFQKYMGGYDNAPVTNTTGVSYEQMKKIGFALMLRSTGAFIGRDSDPTDSNFLASLSKLVPGTAQLSATKVIDRKSMWASDLSSAQGRPEGFDQKSKLDSDLLLDDGQQSYGSLNTFIQPFSGFAPVTMIALGAALVVALKILSEGLELLLKAANPPGVPGDDSIAPTSDNAIKFPGKSQYSLLSDSEAIASLLGFAPIKHNFGEAFDRGVDVFFEFDGTDFLRVAKSPGYYVVLVREIIRSGGTIIRSIVDAFASGNPVTAIQSLLGVIDIIRSSKIVAYVNMVAMLGDKILMLEDEGLIDVDSVGALSEPGQLPNFGKISTIDRLVSNPASRISKNRETNNSTKLAWRTGATPSMYLLPASVINAADYMPADAKLGLGSTLDVPASLYEKQITTRISSDTVKEIEAELDSEYVPFYFHDLRTNEIVSFHAFLSAISDSFNVSFDSGQYFGRVEPLKTYMGTERTINLTFNIVATSPSDFDVMWWKINKLITLLYPQWSKGRQLKVGENQFIQPFSQVMTSSPLIRIRLGDLFKSNYSKFALARLFGLGTDSFSLNGKTTDPARVQQLITFNKAITEEKQRQLQKPVSASEIQKFGYKAGQKAVLIVASGPLHLAPAGAGKALGVVAPSGNLTTAKLTQDVKVTIDDVKSVTLASKLEEPVYLVTIDAEALPEGFSPGPYAVNHGQLLPDDDDVRATVISKGISDPGTISDADLSAIRDFFDADNNVVVRSFESVAGRGLAGFITSMTFDWKTPTWETNALGRRAPQWCQIVLAFSPVHDIAPGIDADGFNRAPIYNVGETVGHIGSDVSTDGSSEQKFNNYRRDISKMRKPKG